MSFKDIKVDPVIGMRKSYVQQEKDWASRLRAETIVIMKIDWHRVDLSGAI